MILAKREALFYYGENTVFDKMAGATQDVEG
jgi:hypothetical protein